MIRDKIQVDVKGKLIELTRCQVGCIWVVNGTMTEIKGIDGEVLPCEDIDFVSIFKARIQQRAIIQSEGVLVFNRQAYTTTNDREIVVKVLDQLPHDTYVLASIKTLVAFRHPRILVPERVNDRRIRYEFEQSQTFL